MVLKLIYSLITQSVRILPRVENFGCIHCVLRIFASEYPEVLHKWQNTDSQRVSNGLPTLPRQHVIVSLWSKAKESRNYWSYYCFCCSWIFHFKKSCNLSLSAFLLLFLLFLYLYFFFIFIIYSFYHRISLILLIQLFIYNSITL